MKSVIALIVVLGGYFLAYFLQSRCTESKIKFRGKTMQRARHIVHGRLISVWMQGSRYFSKAIDIDTGELIELQIDEKMMSSLPDDAVQSNTDEINEGLCEVLLYKEEQENCVFTYALTPPEIRFKLKLIVAEEGVSPSKVQVEEIKKTINFLYQIRLVFFTLSFVAILQAPTIAIILSALAAMISYRNVLPIQFTKIIRCAIIKIIKNKTLPSQYIPNNTTKSKSIKLPPGHISWTENHRFLHLLNQKLEEAETSPSANDIVSPVQRGICEEYSRPEECAADVSANELPDFSFFDEHDDDPFGANEFESMADDEGEMFHSIGSPQSDTKSNDSEKKARLKQTSACSQSRHKKSSVVGVLCDLMDESEKAMEK